MIIVTARLVFETRAHRDRAAERSSAVQAATRADEPGCLAYCFAPDPVVATEMQVFELWEDAASLEAHFAHPSYAAMVKALAEAGGFVASINRLYVADDRGPVYDEDGTPRIHALDR